MNLVLPKPVGEGGSAFPANILYYINRGLKQRRRRSQQERYKSNRFRLAKQQLGTCITLFCTFLCRHCTTTTWKCLISRFVEDVNTRQRLSLSSSFSWTSIQSFRIQLQKKIANIWQIEWDRISAIKFEAARLHCLGDVFVAVAVDVA